MQTRVIETGLGRIFLEGELSEDSRRPVLVVIRGIFLPADYLDFLIEDLAETADVLLAHLPGMHAPTLRASDPATITEGFREALSSVLAGRTVVLAGVSAGCLVALGLSDLPMVRRAVLVEPFLDVGACWALREFAAARSEKGSLLRAWLVAYLGPNFAADYSALADLLTRPATVIVGEEPLDPPRPLNRLPSLTSEAERELWRDRAGVTLVVTPGAGHDVPRVGRPLLVAELRRALELAVAG